MKGLRKFNVNDYVYIQITEDGWNHLNKTLKPEYIKHCILPKKVVISEYDDIPWYRLQLHEVMSILPISGMFDVKYRTNIMFDELDLKEI